MRSLLPFLAFALLLPASAEAQRRYRVTHDDETRGTDLQVHATGLALNGVGLRFWLSPQTAVATRLDFSFTDFDDPDATLFGLGAAVDVESHMRSYERVHPFFALGGRVGIISLSSDATNDTDTQTVFGGAAGLGAEARLMEGLTLNARYELAVDVATGDDRLAGVGNGPVGGQPKLNVRLGGVPRLALSYRF